MQLELEKVDRYHEAFGMVRRGDEAVLTGALLKGKGLFIIKSMGLWKLSSSPCKSFVHWVEMEAGCKKSTAYALIGLYEKFADVIENNADLQSVDVTKAYLLLPFIADDATVDEKEELLYMAKETPWPSFCDNIRKMKGKIATDECPHDEIEAVERCKKCGKWFRS